MTRLLGCVHVLILLSTRLLTPRLKQGEALSACTGEVSGRELNAVYIWK